MELWATPPCKIYSLPSDKLTEPWKIHTLPGKYHQFFVDLPANYVSLLECKYDVKPPLLITTHSLFDWNLKLRTAKPYNPL